MDSTLYCNNTIQFNDLIEMILLCIKEIECDWEIKYYSQDHKIVHSGKQLLNEYLNDDNVYSIGILCNYLYIITEAPKHKSEEFLEMFCQDYNVEINMELELEIYDSTINKGLKLLKEVVTKIENSTYGDVVILNDTSVVVYLNSKTKKIIIDDYWKMEI